MKSNKLIVGLTGYYCSGKSLVEKILKEKYNFFIIDVDKEGHIALEKNKDIIAYHFGNNIITENKIDRKKLAKIVFSDQNKLNLLNNILHPLMIESIKEKIEKCNNHLILINAALLFQMNLDKLCDFIIFIKSSLYNILKRGIKRDKRKIKEILKILYIQKKNAFNKKKLRDADIYYIKNNGNIKKLSEKLEKIINMELKYGKQQ